MCFYPTSKTTIQLQKNRCTSENQPKCSICLGFWVQFFYCLVTAHAIITKIIGLVDPTPKIIFLFYFLQIYWSWSWQNEDKNKKSKIHLIFIFQMLFHWEGRSCHIWTRSRYFIPPWLGLNFRAGVLKMTEVWKIIKKWVLKAMN